MWENKSKCQFKCWLTFYLEKVVEIYIKSKKHKLAIINKLLLVNFFWQICCVNLFGSNYFQILFTCFRYWQNVRIRIDRKRLNYNENLKFMPVGKNFHFYAIWELCHLGSYQFKLALTSIYCSNDSKRGRNFGFGSVFFRSILTT